MTTNAPISTLEAENAQNIVFDRTNPFLSLRFPLNPLPRGAFRNRLRLRPNPKPNPCKASLATQMALLCTTLRPVRLQPQDFASSGSLSFLFRQVLRWPRPAGSVWPAGQVRECPL